MYHAGQVSSDLAAIGAAVGASPLELQSAPNLLDDEADDSIVDIDAPVYLCCFEPLSELRKFIHRRRLLGTSTAIIRLEI